MADEPAAPAPEILQAIQDAERRVARMLEDARQEAAARIERARRDAERLVAEQRAALNRLTAERIGAAVLQAEQEAARLRLAAEDEAAMLRTRCAATLEETADFVLSCLFPPAARDAFDPVHHATSAPRQHAEARGDMRP